MSSQLTGQETVKRDGPSSRRWRRVRLLMLKSLKSVLPAALGAEERSLSWCRGVGARAGEASGYTSIEARYWPALPVSRPLVSLRAARFLE
jgi:hypothetical protein